MQGQTTRRTETGPWRERENLGMTFASLFMSRVERQVSRYKNETTKWEKALKIRRLLPKSKHVHKYDQRLADCH